MKKIGVVIIVLFSFSGCKKIHCPEFPANLNYFPYYIGQEIKFINTQQTIQSFAITEKTNSKGNSYEWNCKCECFIYSMFCAISNQDTMNIRCEINIYGQENVGSVFINSYIGDKLQNEEFFQTGVTPPNTKTPYDEIYKYFDDTISMEKENGLILKKIILIKNKGIVSFITADGEEWKLVE